MDGGIRILERDGHYLHIMDQADGKLILYITTIEEGIADGFTVGLAPRSLGELRAMAGSATFDWTIRDETLRVEGRDGAWALTFSMNAPPYLSTTLELTGAETEAVKAELFAAAG